MKRGYRKRCCDSKSDDSCDRYNQCENKRKHRCNKPRGTKSRAAPMMTSDSSFTDNDWKTTSLVTVGEFYHDAFDFNQKKFDYEPNGLFDGLGAVKLNDKTVRVYANHEIFSGESTSYLLKNGTQLTGARVDAWDMTKKCSNVKKGKVAYHTIIDREGLVVTDPSQLNKGREESAAIAAQVGQAGLYFPGFTRFCSGGCVRKGEHGFSNTAYITTEEFIQGSVVTIDACEETIYIAPMLGQYNGERAAPVSNFDSNKVVMVICDDTDTIPLWLYVGEVGTKPPTGAAYNPPDFLTRNGLGYGKLFAWVPNNPNYVNGNDFFGTNNVADGKFIAVNHYDPSKEGVFPYDNLGFLPNTSLFNIFFEGIVGPLTQAGLDLGCFQFERLEDVHPNPKNPSEIVFATTGGLGTPEPYGKVYTITLESSVRDELMKNIEDITELDASLRILYDPEDGGGGQVTNPNDGIRSPDNLTWGHDGYIYVQEDLTSSSMCTDGAPPSVWRINPHTSAINRILVMDREAVPKNQIDIAPDNCRSWESSGVIDVSHLFCNPDNRTMLLLDVMAHGILQPQPPFGFTNLTSGGQMLLAVGPKCPDLNAPRSLVRECKCCVDNDFAVRNAVQQTNSRSVKSKSVKSESVKSESLTRKELIHKYFSSHINEKLNEDEVNKILEKLAQIEDKNSSDNQ